MTKVTDQAYVTLATNDSYSLGALTLGHSLLRVKSSRRLVCMISKEISPYIREKLAEVFELVEVDVLDSGDSVNLELLSRPDLGVTFTKLHCWRLTQFSKCVFLDADTLLLKNIDDLFEREEFSAAADVGWPDCFNSGVFVFKPSEETYKKLLKFALSNGSFDGGDQGLLNAFFSDWATKDIKFHLPFLYNVVAQTFYSYLPAFKKYGKDAKVLHFIGLLKPWYCHYDPQTNHVSTPSDQGQHLQDFLQLWWQIFTQDVNLSKDQLKKLGVSPPSSSFSTPSHHGYSDEQFADLRRKHNWERGHIDYMGIDSFQYIQQKISSKTGKNSVHQEDPQNNSPQKFPMPVSTPTYQQKSQANGDQTSPQMQQPQPQQVHLQQQLQQPLQTQFQTPINDHIQSQQQHHLHQIPTNLQSQPQTQSSSIYYQDKHKQHTPHELSPPAPVEVTRPAPTINQLSDSVQQTVLSAGNPTQVITLPPNKQIIFASKGHSPQQGHQVHGIQVKTSSGVKVVSKAKSPQSPQSPQAPQ